MGLLFMDINKSCRSFLRNIYSYDIASCHFNILKNIHHPICDEIENLPKLEKNIKIGLLMKNDSSLTKILRSSTIGTISQYLSKNEISDEDIITRQYDGFLTTKKLKHIDIGLDLKLELRNVYNIFIPSSARDSYIATDFKEYSFKGIPNKYKSIEEIYKKILAINFLCKNSIFSMMDKIKNEILYGDDIDVYFIPSNLNTNFGSIYLKNYGETTISKSVLGMVDYGDIDRHRYYDIYIRSFFESILIEFL
jgi:hypothetical protein